MEVSRYKLTEEIGAGAFSKVFLVEQLPGEIPLCCKVVPKEQVHDNETQSKVFVTEVSALIILKHPSILTLRDIASDETNYYMFMEYFKDGSLADLLKRRIYLEEKEAQSIFSTVMTALQFCHSRNVIHRDIKPGNILLRGGVGVLADFGVSSFSLAYRSRSGTIAYMAPELFESHTEVHGVKSDVWSCGIVLYEMLSGKRPWNAKHHSELAQMIRKGQLTFPPRVSANARDLISKMLEVNPMKRISTHLILSHPFCLSARRNQLRRSSFGRQIIDYSTNDLSSHFAEVVGQATSNMGVAPRRLLGASYNKFDIPKNRNLPKL